MQSANDKDESARLAASQAEVNARQSFYVVDAPTVPTEPTTSLRKSALRASVFVLVGLIFSIIMVIGGALLDRTLTLPLDVQLDLGLPVMAVIPNLTPRRNWNAGRGDGQLPANSATARIVSGRSARDPLLPNGALAITLLAQPAAAAADDQTEPTP